MADKAKIKAKIKAQNKAKKVAMLTNCGKAHKSLALYCVASKDDFYAVYSRNMKLLLIK
ncbi:hypothetical protein ACO0LL_17715 [Undibacterium sp. TC4M20W]|uniref:hypothetical protein n=1 Tax=Undibacterium sp. TC4M20W TaxID=3413052 RepID=UPI003BF20C5B